MSARSSKKARRHLDHYPTPPDPIFALLNVSSPPTKLIVDPACGEGGILQVVRNAASTGVDRLATERELLGVDLNPKMVLQAHAAGIEAHHADWLSPLFGLPPELQQRLDDADGWSVVGNPPYTLAEPFLSETWRRGPAYMAQLLRLDILGGSGGESTIKRCRWLNDNPPQGIYPLSWRPRFDPTRTSSDSCNYVWLVWRRDVPPSSCSFEVLFRETWRKRLAA